jgi:excisionase family DNA binding protein
MLHKNIDRETIAQTIALAVVAALQSLEQPEPQSPPRVVATLSPVEFSKESGIGLNRVRALLHTGKIRHIRCGKRVLILRTEIQGFLERELIGGEK